MKWSERPKGEELKGKKRSFVEPACNERDVVVTMTVPCMCVNACMHASVHLYLSEPMTSTIVDGFQNNVTQLFSITY